MPKYGIAIGRNQIFEPPTEPGFGVSNERELRARSDVPMATHDSTRQAGIEVCSVTLPFKEEEHCRNVNTQEYQKDNLQHRGKGPLSICYHPNVFRHLPRERHLSSDHGMSLFNAVLCTASKSMDMRRRSTFNTSGVQLSMAYSAQGRRCG